MDETRILSGDLLVSKGAIKLNSTLPEVGLKDVTPNGSWLEQKQIQAALEARKQLIEVERIEKSGVLSHADWNEELMLAEVTQKVGSYWQYLGHYVGKRLFLHPEEALFLIEINCLLLKYNEVKVSLQQAYALMLRSNISLKQYKVYASLSRLGYKVFRHKIQPISVPKENVKNARNVNKTCFSKTMADKNGINNDKLLGSHSRKTDEHTIDEINENVNEADPECSTTKVTINQSEISIATYNDSKLHIKSEKCDVSASTSENIEITKVDTKNSKLRHPKYIQYKIDKLKSRNYKQKESNSAHNISFGNIPEFTNNPIVTVTAPERRYLPGKVYLINKSYHLNVEKIRTKSTVSDELPTTPSPSGSMNHVCSHNVNRLRHTHPNSDRGNQWSEFFNFRFSSQPNPFRHFNFYRPPSNLNYFQFNMIFQRPLLYSQFGARVMLNPFLQPSAPNFNEDVSMNNNYFGCRRKRSRDVLKQEHFASIQRLAMAAKNSILAFRLSDNNVSNLNHLIQTYNTRYKARLRLSHDFNVIADENIIDTIEVDDEEEHKAKKVKKSETPDAFNSNLQRLTRLAHKLKDLEMKSEATSRHRRILSHLLKKFNTSYNVDYYVNDNFDIINRNDLTVLSSSDSDGVIETQVTCRKKLRNPFSILKQISEKHSEENCPSTSSMQDCPFKYNDITVKTFKKGWLPDKSDFGRAEVVSQDFTSEVINSRREEFLYDFLKIQPEKFKNWLDIKISFLQCLQETCESFHYESKKNMGLQSLVKPEEFNDSALVLRKLSIFDNHITINEDTNLEIAFDVYNRDVQNFKKSNRPLPIFRIVCLKESSTMPSGMNIASLHSKYKDNVAILFAVVGVSSISYLQLNPVDLPVSSNINTD